MTWRHRPGPQLALKISADRIPAGELLILRNSWNVTGFSKRSERCRRSRQSSPPAAQRRHAQLTHIELSAKKPPHFAERRRHVQERKLAGPMVLVARPVIDCAAWAWVPTVAIGIILVLRES